MCRILIESLKTEQLKISFLIQAYPERPRPFPSFHSCIITMSAFILELPPLSHFLELNCTPMSRPWGGRRRNDKCHSDSFSEKDRVGKKKEAMVVDG